MKKLFIRLDRKGEWLGTEHQSRVAGNEEILENGISCFELEDKVCATEELSSYWNYNVGLNIDEYECMQVTIFKGEKIKEWGSDEECLANCIETVAEKEAKPFMEELEKIEDEFDYDEITQEEYQDKIEILIDNLLKGSN